MKLSGFKRNYSNLLLSRQKTTGCTKAPWETSTTVETKRGLTINAIRVNVTPCQAHLSSIKNIIFDLGGVIIDIEPERSLRAFEKYANGLSEPSVYRHQLFHELETGQITPASFREQIRTVLKLDIADEAIDECMFAMLGEIPAERIRLLERMKRKYFTLLLSNTNSIHYDAVAGYLGRTYGTTTFDTYFHKSYYSHIVGLRKPDVKIFELVLCENNLKPEETLYLDDTGEHLKSARSLGIQTVKVTTAHPAVEILKDL